MSLLARTTAVSRRYGDVVALDDVSMDVPQGQLLGLLGPNGAGKSTLLDLLSGIRRPTTGSVELFGGDPRDPASRRRLGTTPQETGLPATLKVREVVDFVGSHFEDPVPRGELLVRFGLGDVAGRQTGGLSGGQKRRLAVALAFAGRPDLVLLDEPTTDLDVDARRSLWAGIASFHDDGGTVVLTSHYLEEVEALAERVVVIDCGQVRADGRIAEIRSLVPSRRLQVYASELPELAGVERHSRSGDRHALWVSDSDAVVRDLVRSGISFHDLEVSPRLARGRVPRPDPGPGGFR